MLKYNFTKDNYSLIRKSIRNGDILAVSGKSWVSKMIKVFTKGKGAMLNGKLCEINHVGIFKWIETELFVIEAHHTVSPRRFSEKYKKHKGRIFVVRPSYKQNETKQVILNALRLCDKKYDWLAVLKLIKSKAKYKLNKKYYCSELINVCRDYFYTDKKFKHMKPHPLIMKEPNFKYEIKNII